MTRLHPAYRELADLQAPGAPPAGRPETVASRPEWAPGEPPAGLPTPAEMWWNEDTELERLTAAPRHHIDVTPLLSSATESIPEDREPAEVQLTDESLDWGPTDLVAPAPETDAAAAPPVGPVADLPPAAETSPGWMSDWQAALPNLGLSLAPANAPVSEIDQTRPELPTAVPAPPAAPPTTTADPGPGDMDWAAQGLIPSETVGVQYAVALDETAPPESNRALPEVPAPEYGPGPGDVTEQAPSAAARPAPIAPPRTPAPGFWTGPSARQASAAASTAPDRPTPPPPAESEPRAAMAPGEPLEPDAATTTDTRTTADHTEGDPPAAGVIPLGSVAAPAAPEPSSRLAGLARLARQRAQAARQLQSPRVPPPLAPAPPAPPSAPIAIGLPSLPIAMGPGPSAPALDESSGQTGAGETPDGLPTTDLANVAPNAVLSDVAPSTLRPDVAPSTLPLDVAPSVHRPDVSESTAPPPVPTASQLEARFCWQCGTAVTPGSRFCATCGTRLAAPEEPATPPPPVVEPTARRAPPGETAEAESTPVADGGRDAVPPRDRPAEPDSPHLILPLRTPLPGGLMADADVDAVPSLLERLTAPDGPDPADLASEALGLAPEAATEWGGRPPTDEAPWAEAPTAPATEAWDETPTAPPTEAWDETPAPIPWDGTTDGYDQGWDAASIHDLGPWAMSPADHVHPAWREPAGATSWPTPEDIQPESGAPTILSWEGTRASEPSWEAGEGVGSESDYEPQAPAPTWPQGESEPAWVAEWAEAVPQVWEAPTTWAPEPAPWDGTTEQPTWDGTTEQPMWDGTSAQPTWDTTTEQPTWDGTSAQPTWDGTSAQPTWDATTEQPTWDATTEQPTWDATTAQPTWDATTEQPTWDGTTAQPTWDATTAQPTWDATTAQPTWDATTEQPTWDGTTAQPTWDGTTAQPTWDGTTAPPTWDGTTAPPTWDGTTEAPVWNNAAAPVWDAAPVQPGGWEQQAWDDSQNTGQWPMADTADAGVLWNTGSGWDTTPPVTEPDLAAGGWDPTQPAWDGATASWNTEDPWLPSATDTQITRSVPAWDGVGEPPWDVAEPAGEPDGVEGLGSDVPTWSEATGSAPAWDGAWNDEPPSATDTQATGLTPLQDTFGTPIWDATDQSIPPWYTDLAIAEEPAPQAIDSAVPAAIDADAAVDLARPTTADRNGPETWDDETVEPPWDATSTAMSPDSPSDWPQEEDPTAWDNEPSVGFSVMTPPGAAALDVALTPHSPSTIGPDQDSDGADPADLRTSPVAAVDLPEAWWDSESDAGELPADWWAEEAEAGQTADLTDPAMAEEAWGVEDETPASTAVTDTESSPPDQAPVTPQPTRRELRRARKLQQRQAKIDRLAALDAVEPPVDPTALAEASARYDVEAPVGIVASAPEMAAPDEEAWADEETWAGEEAWVGDVEAEEAMAYAPEDLAWQADAAVDESTADTVRVQADGTANRGASRAKKSKPPTDRSARQAKRARTSAARASAPAQTNRGQGLRWLLISALVPGLGLLKTGRKAWAIPLLILEGVLILIGLWFLVDASVLARAVFSPTALRIFPWVAAGLAIVWLLAIVLTYTRLQPRAGRAPGFIVVGLLTVLALLGVALTGPAAARQASVIDTALSDSQGPHIAATEPTGGSFLNPWSDTDRVNILLLGLNRSVADDTGTTSLMAESIMVASMDPKTGNTVLVGLPRSLTQAPFPEGSDLQQAFPRGWYDGTNPSNTNYQLGAMYARLPMDVDQALYPSSNLGAEAMKLAVGTALGLPINYYIVLDLDSMAALVDAVGGLTVNINKDIPLDNRTLSAGPDQDLDGATVVEYVRNRSVDDDAHRMARTRCVVYDLLQQADLNSLVGQLAGVEDFDASTIRSDIPPSAAGAVADLALRARSGTMIGVQFVNNQGGFVAARPNFPEMHDTVEQAIQVSLSAESVTANPAEYWNPQPLEEFCHFDPQAGW